MIKTISTQLFQGKETDQQAGLTLTLLDDGQVVSIHEPVEVRARNFDGDIAVLKSTVSDNTINITPTAELPNGSYSIEVWIGDDNNREIYPSKGYLKINVNKALLTGDQIKVLDNDGLADKIKQVAAGLSPSVDDTGWIDLLPFKGTQLSPNFAKPQYRTIENHFYMKGIYAKTAGGTVSPTLAGKGLIDNSQTLDSDSRFSLENMSDYRLIACQGLNGSMVSTNTALAISFIDDKPVIYNGTVNASMMMFFLDGIDFLMD